MLKGCQRKIILLRDTGSNIFEEAYFVLKADAEARRDLSESDMVSEARRIVEENTLSLSCSAGMKKSKSAKNKSASFGWFFAGCFASFCLLGLLMIIF